MSKYDDSVKEANELKILLKPKLSKSVGVKELIIGSTIGDMVKKTFNARIYEIIIEYDGFEILSITFGGKTEDGEKI